MRAVLRLIAALTILGVASNAFLAATRWELVRTDFMLPWSPKAAILAGIAVLGLASVYAAVRLWQFRDNGRILLAAVLTALMAVSIIMIIGSMGTRFTAVRACLEAMMVGILLSSGARNVCAAREQDS
jgi:phosphate/sulfate permease